MYSNGTLDALMFGHHLLCLLFFPFATYKGIGGPWVVWFIATEVSSVPLTLWQLMGMKSMKLPFVITFFVWRLLPAMAWVRQFMADQPAHPFAFTVLLPIPLNLYWGWRILRGAALALMAAFGGGKKKN